MGDLYVDSGNLRVYRVEHRDGPDDGTSLLVTDVGADQVPHCTDLRVVESEIFRVAFDTVPTLKALEYDLEENVVDDLQWCIKNDGFPDDESDTEPYEAWARLNMHEVVHSVIPGYQRLMWIVINDPSIWHLRVDQDVATSPTVIDAISAAIADHLVDHGYNYLEEWYKVAQERIKRDFEDDE